ncbi:MAG: hypothetical protein ACFCVD_02095 [Nodosilinea sp.]
MDCLFCRGTGLVQTKRPHAETDLENCMDCNGTGQLRLTVLLAQFPEQLKRTAEGQIANDIDIRDLQAEVDRLTAEIELAIAQDTSLKNDQQRKAKRHELMQSDRYQSALYLLQKAQDNQQRLKVKRQYLADQFAVAKLMAQEHIASLTAD